MDPSNFLFFDKIIWLIKIQLSLKHTQIQTNLKYNQVNLNKQTGWF